MAIRKREGNRPDRRVAVSKLIAKETLEALQERLRYVGSANHKSRPGDYGFGPSHNPRPTKSLCDHHRAVLLSEASKLFQRGIKLGVMSTFAIGGVPKYVWAVDEDDEVYEAKTRPERDTDYHGYRLGDDEQEMHRYILKIWRQRVAKP